LTYQSAHQSRKKKGGAPQYERCIIITEKEREGEIESLYTKIPRCRERRSLPEHTIVWRLEREGQRWRERERKKGGGRDSYGERGRPRDSHCNRSCHV
jgi:hypothetical protein